MRITIAEANLSGLAPTQQMAEVGGVGFQRTPQGTEAPAKTFF